MTKPSDDDFLASPLGREITQDGLDEELMAVGHWQARYRILMKLGARMDKLDPHWHRLMAEVPGCESLTWLYHQELDGRHYFLADSEARIVRGLLVLALAACNGKTSQELAAVDLQPWFDTLGLADHLSPSRSNGLAAVVQRIGGYAD